MKLTVLGSGTIAGQTGRNCSGYLVDDRLLLDCGPGIWGSLYKDPERTYLVENLLVSHFHLDHVADLVPLLFVRYVMDTGEDQPLNVYGPPGASARFERFLEPHREWLCEVSYSLRELAPAETRVGDFLVQTLPTGHTGDSACFKLTDTAGISLFYSGDAAWGEDIVELAGGCDLAIIEAAAPSDQPVPDHLTPRLAGRLAARAQVKTLLLTHCYPQVFASDPAGEAAESFGGNTVLAVDGLELLV